MPFAGPIVSPAGIDLLSAVQMRTNDAYAEASPWTTPPAT